MRDGIGREWWRGELAIVRMLSTDVSFVAKVVVGRGVAVGAGAVVCVGNVVASVTGVGAGVDAAAGVIVDAVASIGAGATNVGVGGTSCPVKPHPTCAAKHSASRAIAIIAFVIGATSL